jgi:hypothetical protein
VYHVLNLVVSPLSLASAVETRLAKQLMDVLRSCLQVDADETFVDTDLVIWALMLGGIGTEDVKDRTWFKYQYCDITKRKASSKRWQWTHEVLSSFLWIDFILNEEAIKFWGACANTMHFLG